MTGWLPEMLVHCPFCGEPITLVVDPTAGSQAYIEDCQVCCQPMQVRVEAADGELESVQVDT